MSQSDQRLKQKTSLLKIVEKLYKKDLEEICIKFFVSKSGTKGKVKQKVIDLIERDNPSIDWTTLNKEIKRVYKLNERIKKSPKKCKKEKNRPKSGPEVDGKVGQIAGCESTEYNGQPFVLNIPKPAVNVNESENRVKHNNNYDILSYLKPVHNFQPNSSSVNCSQIPIAQQLIQAMAPPNITGAVHSIPPQLTPIDSMNYRNDNQNYSQMSGFPGVSVASNVMNTNPNYIPVQNPPLIQPIVNTNQNQPNSYSSFPQPINYSINNNYFQNCEQNYFQQNYFQNQIPDVLNPNPQNFGSFVKQQEFLLSQFPKSFQSTDNTDNPLSDDFWFKCLPKFNVIKTLIKAKTIGSLSDTGCELDLNLNVLDLESMANESLQSFLKRKYLKIQLRFSYISDIQTKEQKDCVPEYLCIDVNNRRVFTYSESGETSGPFDLNEFCVLGANKLKFSMSKENYTFLLPCLYEISIVGFQTPESFLETLKQNLFQYLSSDSTKQMIKARSEQLSQDEAIISITNTDTKVKLICPLSCRRIETPCRTHSCKHMECFDALAFFKTNEFRYEWFCPICQKSAQFESLRIDGYFSEILDSTDESITELFIKSDSTYDLINSNKAPVVIELDDTIDDSDDEDISIVDAEGCIVID